MPLAYLSRSGLPGNRTFTFVPPLLPPADAVFGPGGGRANVPFVPYAVPQPDVCWWFAAGPDVDTTAGGDFGPGKYFTVTDANGLVVAQQYRPSLGYFLARGDQVSLHYTVTPHGFAASESYGFALSTAQPNVATHCTFRWPG